MDGQSGPTTRPAFAKVKQVKTINYQGGKELKVSN